MLVAEQPLITGIRRLLRTYSAVRIVDAAVHLRIDDHIRTLQRHTQAIPQDLARVTVGAHAAFVSTASSPREQTLIHGLQWSMLDAALLADGYTVSRSNDARAAIRSWLMQQPHPTGTDPMFAAAARRAAAELPLEGPELPYSAAWKGPPSAPSDLRLVVVLTPRVSRKKQLEALPLRIAGQPKIPVILRPADDGTTAHHKTGALTYTGPQYRALMRAFREHRNPGAFPYWETAQVLNYRPDLWARLDRTHQ